MSLDGVYDQDNVFAKILRGDIPCVRVEETEHSLAIMDAFPQSPGHVLVMPKTEARTLFDLSEEGLEKLIITVRRIAAAVRCALKPDGLIITQFNGEEAGQTVFHLHWHIIPRYAEHPAGAHDAVPADPGDLSALVQRIRDEL